MAAMQVRTSSAVLLVAIGIAAISCAEAPNGPPEAQQEPREPVRSASTLRYLARDRTPYQLEGIFSGRMYGAFETHWYQDFQEDQFWGFYGPDAQKFWDLWEEQKIVPLAYSRWQETGVEDHDFRDGDFYPFLCAEVTFRGRWVEGCRQCARDDDDVVVEEFLDIQVLALEAQDCIPAFGASMRDEWPVSARPRRITSP